MISPIKSILLFNQKSLLPRINQYIVNGLVPVRKIDDLNTISQYENMRKMAITFNITSEPIMENERNTFQLLEQISNHELSKSFELFAYIVSDYDATIDVHSFAQMVGKLADHNVNRIFFYSRLTKVLKEEFLEEVIEESRNLDVLGDPISERLGFYGSKIHTSLAMKNGVKHIGINSERALAKQPPDTSPYSYCTLSDAVELIREGSYKWTGNETECNMTGAYLMAKLKYPQRW
jgi:hypothetical protein